MAEGLAVLVLFAGLVLRVQHFLIERDLWLDEAMLALNIVERGFGGLLQPLDLNQAAPPGFLFLVKIATLVLGEAEWVFRLVPLLASLATLPLFYFLARSVLGTRGALFALVLLAISPTAVEYAGEAKQYAFDLLASILVLMAADFYCRGGNPRAARIGLAVTGSLTLLFSHGVIFVTAIAGFVLLGRDVALRRWSGLGKLAASGAVVMLAGLVDYGFHLRHVAANEHFANYWRNSLTWADPFSSRGIKAISEAWLEEIDLLLGLHLPVLGVLVLIGGLISLAVRGRAFWAATTAMLVAAVTGAALVDRYPFSDRLLLFLIPPLAVGIAAGIEGLILIRKYGIHFAGWILAWLVLGETVRHLHEDEDFLEARRTRRIQPALAYLRENLKSGDVIYVDGQAMPVFRFYTERRAEFSPLLSHRTVYGQHQGKYKGAPEEKLREIGDASRVWAVFQYRRGDYQREMIEFLGEVGTQEDLYSEHNSRVYLFTFGP